MTGQPRTGPNCYRPVCPRGPCLMPLVRRASDKGRLHERFQIVFRYLSISPQVLEIIVAGLRSA